jgi:hypothetical protein
MNLKKMSGTRFVITATDCFNRPGPASAKTGLPWLTMNVLRRIRYDGNPQINFVYDVPLYAAKRLLPTAPISRSLKCKSQKMRERDDLQERSIPLCIPGVYANG